jgi:hypothetical protein
MALLQRSKICAIMGGIFLTGCVAQTVPQPNIDKSIVHIQLVESFDTPGRLGEATWRGNICLVKIRKDVYPNCVTHEIMHCFSGNWHEGYETDNYCYVK